MRTMMKTCRFAVISLAALLGQPYGARSALQQQETPQGILADRTGEVRYLKDHKHHHHHRHKHHKAILDTYVRQNEHGHLAYDDDETGYDHDHVSNYYEIHFPEYLDDDIKPRPFQNCIPESFHENNMHGGKHHHHKHGHHHHKDGGLDHHHHKHSHDGILDDYEGVDDYYYSKGSKGESEGKGKGGKRKGGGSKAKSAKGSKSGKSSKSKGKGYYRNRDLAGRGTVARKGVRTVRRGRNGGGRRGRHHHHAPGRVQARADHETNDTATSEEDHDADHDAEYNDGRNHHPHKHTHKKGVLPLCPATAPKRRTFGPVPTVAPRGPTVAPAPTVMDGGNDMTAPQPADMGGVPVDIPPSTERVLIESRMEYGFFDGTDARAPTMEEIDALLARTSTWYTDQLKMMFPNLDSFDATFASTMTDLSASSPVRVDFDANAFYTEGTEVPTPQELFLAMEALDYQDYIMSAVWDPNMMGGIFDEVNVAGFTARVMPGR